MKAMILSMALLLALTVFASFASNLENDRQIMADKAALAQSYGEGQPQEQLDRFEVREFVPDNIINEREEDMTKSLFLGVIQKH